MPRRFALDVTLLADPTRRELVALIGRGVRRPSLLAGALELSRPAISRQLRLLLQAGLLRRRRHPWDGRGISYFITPEMAVPIVAWLAGTRMPGTGGLAGVDLARSMTAAAPDALARDVLALRALALGSGSPADGVPPVYKRARPVPRRPSIVPLRRNRRKEAKPGTTRSRRAPPPG